MQTLIAHGHPVERVWRYTLDQVEFWFWRCVRRESTEGADQITRNSMAIGAAFSEKGSQAVNKAVKAMRFFGRRARHPEMSGADALFAVLSGNSTGGTRGR